jgi:hypothetical protein
MCIGLARALYELCNTLPYQHAKGEGEGGEGEDEEEEEDEEDEGEEDVPTQGMLLAQEVSGMLRQGKVRHTYIHKYIHTHAYTDTCTI